MENILLIGIGGAYNYGCEAIIRGTVNILKSVDSTIKVNYASYNFEDDCKRLKGCELNIIRRPQRSRWNIHNILRKLFSYLNIHYVIPYDNSNWIEGFDTIFSIGGDIYTLSSNGSCNLSLPVFLSKCQKKGIKYILWGASVGKFEKNPAALQFYKKHLPGIDLIVAREPNTIEYLKSLGVISNVCFAPDPAFFVESPRKPENRVTEKITIGINLSPMSALYEYGNMEKAIYAQAKSIMGMIDTLSCNILLLPHVLSSNPNDNDLVYLKNIYSSIPNNYQSRIDIVDIDPQFIGIKEYIAKCNYIIAARMHCAINAITVSVPTLFLAYSEKAKGMSEVVYNTNECVISLKDFENVELVTEKIKKWNYNSQLNSIEDFDFKNIVIE